MYGKQVSVDATIKPIIRSNHNRSRGFNRSQVLKDKKQLVRVDLIKKVTSWEMPLGNNKSSDFFKPLSINENSKLIEDTREEIQNLGNFVKVMLEFLSMSKVC
jgi:hypothetical protein